MASFCYLCKDQLGPKGNNSNPRETSNSLKTLLQYLNADVVVTSSEVWEETIPSKICQYCAYTANGFGSLHKGLLGFLEEWIRRLAGSESNKSQLSSDATIPPPSPPSPGDWLRGEILKKYELKLNPDKPNEEELPCEQKDHNVLEAEGGGRRSRHHSEEASQVVMLQPQVSNPALDDDTAVGNIQKASVERNHATGGNEPEVVISSTADHVDHQSDQLGMDTTATAPDSHSQLDDPQITSGENRSNVATRVPQQGGSRRQSELSPITSLPTPTSRALSTKSRCCTFANCRTRFYGPKASEKKHYTCFHTVEHLPSQFLGFSQKDVNEVRRDICSQEFLQNREEPNTFKCPFCQASGINGKGKKFHLLLQHIEVVKSRLEARRAVATKANYLDEATNFVDEPQQMLHVTEYGDHSDVGQDGEMDELPEGQVEDMEEEEQSYDMDDEEMEEGEGHSMEESELDDDDDDGDQEDEAETMDSNMSGEDSDLEEDNGPPKLEASSYSCLYCNIRLYGLNADLPRHMMCNHTVAYFREKLPDSTTEEDVDRVIQGLYSDPNKQNIFTCSFCQKSITGDKKYHLLKEYLMLVQSNLKEIGKVANNSEEPPVPSLPPTPSQVMSIKREVAEGGESVVPAASPPPEVEEIETTPTEQMLRRQNDKLDFDQNRETFRFDTVNKPRFSYIFLIKQAIVESPASKLKTSDICSWIQSIFGFYQNPEHAETMKRTVRSTLSGNRCFEKHKMKGKEGVWKVDLKEFYKPGRKLSNAPSKSGVASTPNNAALANVKREVFEGDLSSQQSSSTRNEQLEPPQGDLGLVANNQVERAAHRGRRKNEMENRRLPGGAKTKPSRKCGFCDTQIIERKQNVEHHMMCMHPAVYFSEKLSPETTQEHLNKAVARLCKDRVTSKSPGKFHCLLCRQDKTGEWKYHLFKAHFKHVLSRVKKGPRGGVPPTANFDNLLASADLAGSMHIKQENTVPMEQES